MAASDKQFVYQRRTEDLSEMIYRFPLHGRLDAYNTYSTAFFVQRLDRCTGKPVRADEAVLG